VGFGLLMVLVVLGAPWPVMAQADEDAAPAPAGSAAPTSDDGPVLNRAEPIDLNAIAAKAARYPDNPYVLNEYANQLLQKGRLDDAVAFFNKAVSLNPEFTQAWNNLGVAYQARSEFSKATKAYKTALALSPNYAQVHYNLGANFDAMGKYKKAIRSYQTAFELDPGMLDLKQNPQLATNQHVTAVVLQTYVDRGGNAYFPVVSAYPKSGK
jgi:tetratricopeptide (TPR) repeat protein